MKSSALKILNENDLKGETPFLRPLADVLDKTQPRALRALSQIIDNGLCHRCGSCVGICPTDTLGLDNESYPKVKNLSACTDCDLCVKVCPGDEFDFHKTHLEKFGNEGDITSTHGQFLESFVAYSNDSWIREHSTSGGLVTGILLYLLEEKLIDGAVVIVSDPENIWKGKPIIARTKDELLLSLKSKYSIAPTNSVFNEIREMEGRYVLVGLPCQIHGYFKARELDAKLKERIVLTIGIFCHAAVEHDGYRLVWESLGEKKSNAKKFISRVGKHPGTPHIEKADGTLEPVYFPEKKGFRPSSMEMINILYRLYSPKRCLTCFDALAEFADISIGDPWLAPPDDQINFYDGWSFALVRDQKAKEIVKTMQEKNLITIYNTTEKEALSCNKMMSSEKVWRAFRIIETHRRQGKAVPKYADYEITMPPLGLKQFLKTEINMFTHIFCFLPLRHRAIVLKFMLSNGGYALLWINNQRRNLRYFIRDNYVKFKRNLIGRK